MELKVWVEGIQRIVCGVTEQTTCQDVVYALAHATGKTGRFTLNERWRSNERLLSPQDHPLKILMKWGEYSNDVQFILQRSQLDDSKGGNSQTKQKQGVTDNLHNFSPTSSYQEFNTKSPERNKDIRKSLTFSGGTNPHASPEQQKADNVGIVKGVPQKNYDVEVKDARQVLKSEDGSYSSPTKNDSLLNYSKREAPPYRDPPDPGSYSPQQRVLPPYRDPPPPIQSPTKNRPSSPSSNSSVISQSRTKIAKPKRNVVKDYQGSQSGSENSFQEAVICNAQYRDLVRLVNLQREKLSAQQCELTKVCFKIKNKYISKCHLILILMYILFNSLMQKSFIGRLRLKNNSIS